MRMIDADALMEKVCGNCRGHDCRPDATDTVYGCMFADAIDDAPTVDSVPYKHGHWIDSCGHPLAMQLALNSGKCSECGLYSGLWAINQPYKYCPFCGSRMDGGADNG